MWRWSGERRTLRHSCSGIASFRRSCWCSWDRSSGWAGVPPPSIHPPYHSSVPSATVPCSCFYCVHSTAASPPLARPRCFVPGYGCPPCSACPLPLLSKIFAAPAAASASQLRRDFSKASSRALLWRVASIWTTRRTWPSTVRTFHGRKALGPSCSVKRRKRRRRCGRRTRRG